VSVIYVIYRSLVSALCRHEWHVVHCVGRWDLYGNQRPLEYQMCRKCGVHRDDRRAWDD